MATPTKPKITDVIDEYLDLPEEFAVFCSAQNDDGTNSPGKIRFLLNKDVMDLYRDAVDDLENSRGLPDNAHAGNIQVSDPVVLFLAQNDPEILVEPEDTKAQLAREKASGWYERQKSQVASDAIFVAITYYNDLDKIITLPYKEGEISLVFPVVDGGEVGETEKSGRPLPNWLRKKSSYQIPLPERRLGNEYERRLKQLYQLVEMCGPVWTAQFRRLFEKGIVKMVQLAEPRDTAGFPTKPSNRKVRAESGSKS